MFCASFVSDAASFVSIGDGIGSLFEGVTWSGREDAVCSFVLRDDDDSDTASIETDVLLVFILEAGVWCREVER